MVKRWRFILLEHLLPDVLGAYGRIRYQNHGLELDDISTHTLTMRDDEPLSLEQTVNFRLEYKRGDWQVMMKTESKLTADATHFYVTNLLEAYEGTVHVL